MKVIELNKLGSKASSELIVVLKMNDGALGNLPRFECDYEFMDSILHITIEQCYERTICIKSDSPIAMALLWDEFATIEKLLMLMDGEFYSIKSVKFLSSDSTDGDEFDVYADECIDRRLNYYKTDPAYYYLSNGFIKYDTVLNPELISKWHKLQDELDIVHNMALYNIADTGITHDIKCAFFIEELKPLVEIIEEYDKSFSISKQGKSDLSLKDCIGGIISNYGKDIFAKEFSKKKDEFLKTLVNTRNRIMHIKTRQEKKYLSGTESVLYLVKLCHLYRVVILSLLGIDYELYRPAVIKSVDLWNKWEGVLDAFINRL